MSDPAKGLNTADNVARIVCKSAWGRLSSTKVDNVKQYLWELAHDTLTFCKPDNANLLANLPQLEIEDWSIANYMDYIDAAFPCLTGSESEEEKAEREDCRNKMRAKFAQPGGQGSKFKNTAEKLIKNLALPKGAKDELGITGDQGMEPETESPEKQHHDGEESEDEETKAENARKALDKRMLRELYSEGRYHLIPSFFRTLMYLKK